MRVAGKKQCAKIRIMPSKLFERDGLVIRSVLKLTAAQAKEGGFFDVETLGGAALVDLVREKTHTCYLGDRTHRHDWGWGCGTCPACELRARGWEIWNAAKAHPSR